MNNPGKYDAACTQAREATHAQGCLLVVLNGERGTGFSIQGTSRIALATLVDVLELALPKIRADLARDLCTDGNEDAPP